MGSFTEWKKYENTSYLCYITTYLSMLMLDANAIPLVSQVSVTTFGRSKTQVIYMLRSHRSYETNPQGYSLGFYGAWWCSGELKPQRSV